VPDTGEPEHGPEETRAATGQGSSGVPVGLL
jgi:hypothetical protein